MCAGAWRGGGLEVCDHLQRDVGHNICRVLLRPGLAHTHPGHNAEVEQRGRQLLHNHLQVGGGGGGGGVGASGRGGGGEGGGEGVGQGVVARGA